LKRKAQVALRTKPVSVVMFGEKGEGDEEETAVE
jgi:hypothetical protein